MKRWQRVVLAYSVFVVLICTLVFGSIFALAFTIDRTGDLRYLGIASMLAILVAATKILAILAIRDRILGD
ncbi:MAG: hypothetical protein KIT31_08335 [Deltaproteobacteria bacterium]|nr:hypothetical protein [Deltaproteobacteria bacterium]